MAEFASDVVAVISDAEREVDVELTPPARDIAALFVVGAAYEVGFLVRGIDEANVELDTSVLARQLPEMLGSIPTSGLPGESGRRLVMSVDLWHWLGSGAGEAQLRTWPYEKS